VSGDSTMGRALRALADLAEIRGAAAEAHDLRRAAGAVGALSTSATAALMQRARRDRLHDEPEITPLIHRRLRELALAGPDLAVSSARAVLPGLLRSLLDLGVVETEEAALLARQLGILTLGELFHALENGRVQETLGDNLDERLRHAAPAIARDAGLVPLGRARDILASLTAAITTSSPAIDTIIISGDARRFESLVSELILVARALDPASAIEQLCQARGIEEILHRGPRRVVVIAQRIEVDVRVTAPDEYSMVLFSTTGSRPHVHVMRARVGHLHLAPSEEDLYLHAGLPFIPPEIRHGRGELEAAAGGKLPTLISREQIRGDLHMHTIYSDGADTVEAMVSACCALGYEYIAITDHSERAAAGRTLRRRDLSRQRAEIEAVRERYPQIIILHGVETDIMPDGSLDFPDRILETFDIVLASLHDSARQDGKTLTRRTLQAIRHPLVNILAHPANRLVGRREGYALDFETVFAAAAETGTALEVDGAPAHLDLEGERAREAIEAGVTLTIDSDCHRARLLERQMALGIGTARRGWVEPRHVLNTRRVDEVRAFIAAKRRRR
jgi:DNA polymerase (family 10)